MRNSRAKSVGENRLPTAERTTEALDRIIKEQGSKPKHIVVDHGTQFDSEHFREWCEGHGIQVRYGAVGEHGSLGVIERFHRSLKHECTRRVEVTSNRESLEAELSAWRGWYNAARPHMFLDGRTPDEQYFGYDAANWRPRIEPRPNVDENTPCASPRVVIEGEIGQGVGIRVLLHEGRPHLPIIQVTRA